MMLRNVTSRDLTFIGQLVSSPKQNWHRPFMVPPLQYNEIFGRKKLIKDLATQLSRAPGGTCFAFYGIPGVGKSTLANAIAREHVINERFEGGVLWVGLRQEKDRRRAKNPKEFLRDCAIALGVPRQAADHPSIEHRKLQIHRRLGSRRVLIIVDDVFDLAEAEAHRLLGNCVHIFTTRLPEIAVGIARSRAIHVDELAPPDATKMLRSYSPAAVKRFPTLTTELVETVGRLPLALHLIGRRIAQAAIGDQADRIRTALETARNQEHREDIDPHIRLSTEILSPINRRSLYALSVLTAKPGDFSKTAAIAVANCSEESLYRLIDVGLVEGKFDHAADGRLTIHKSIADYASRQLTKRAASAAEERMIRYFVEFLRKNRADRRSITAEMENLDAAVTRAIKSGRYDELVLQGANAYSQFLRSRGLNHHAEKYLLAALDAAERLSDNSAAADACLNLAHHLEKLGRYDAAVARLRQFSLFVDQQAFLQLARAHYIHAVIAFNRSDLEKAWSEVSGGFETLFSDESTVTREEKAFREIYSDLLERRCLILMSQKEFGLARADARAGLRLARGLRDECREAEHLLNWSWVGLKDGCLDEAHAKAVRGYNLAVRLELREYEIGFLHRLGCVAAESGARDYAEKLLLRALGRAEDIQHQWYSALLNLELGSLYWRQKDSRAWGPLQMAYEIGAKIGNREIRGEANRMLKKPAELTTSEEGDDSKAMLTWPSIFSARDEFGEPPSIRRAPANPQQIVARIKRTGAQTAVSTRKRPRTTPKRLAIANEGAETYTASAERGCPIITVPTNKPTAK